MDEKYDVYVVIIPSNSTAYEFLSDAVEQISNVTGGMDLSWEDAESLQEQASNLRDW